MTNGFAIRNHRRVRAIAECFGNLLTSKHRRCHMALNCVNVFRKTEHSEAEGDMKLQPARNGTSPLTVVQTAIALGLSQHTVRAWIAQRRLGHVRLGRSIRVPPSEVSRLLDDNFRPAKATLGQGR